MLSLWLTAFSITLASESLIISFLLPSVPPRRLLGICLLANSISHPFLWFVFPRFPPYALWLGCGEVAVVLIETLIYGELALHRRNWPKALRASLLANALSCLLGLLLL